MKELVDSLAKAQADISNAPLNKINPHFRSKYADLASIRDAIVPSLSKHGVALVQTVETIEGRHFVKTSLLHGDDRIDSLCPIMCGPNDKAQQFGSAMTYARRYSLAAIVGIAAEEDDDGNEAQNASNKKHQPKQQPKQEEHKVDPFYDPEKERDELRSIMGTMRSLKAATENFGKDPLKTRMAVLKQESVECAQDLRDHWTELSATVWAEAQ